MEPYKIITKTGDSGTTGLNCGGRVPKDDDRIYVVGKIDTLHAQLGICKIHLGKIDSKCIDSIIKTLFLLMGEIAVKSENKDKTKQFDSSIIEELEKHCKIISDYLESSNYMINDWVVYGSGNLAAAHVDLASKLCREVELLLYRYEIDARQEVSTYFNRLSDFLYLLARKSEITE